MVELFEGPLNEGSILTDEAEESLREGFGRSAEQGIAITPVGPAIELYELATNEEAGPDPTDPWQRALGGDEGAARPAGETPELAVESAREAGADFRDALEDVDLPDPSDLGIDIPLQYKALFWLAVLVVLAYAYGQLFDINLGGS